MSQIILGENLEKLSRLEDQSIDLVYIDPPFNTGHDQRHMRIKIERSLGKGDRTGFGGVRYKSSTVSSMAYSDSFSDFAAFLTPRLQELRRVLSANGSLFFHIDWREVHYCKVLLDEIFGRSSFVNEIIWAYDYGGRSKKKWSSKHDNILWYAKNPKSYTFNFDEMDRIPYMAPGLVGKEKAARGKTPTDVWWHTIVPTNGKERTGYPTQKPLGILERIIKVHSNPNDTVLDCFAGSGTTGVAAAQHSRRFILMDNNPEAVQVQFQRLGRFEPECIGFEPESVE
jgi:site-specific DNA-methyltransferase (adenine-specific)